MTSDDEEARLRAVALQNAQSILTARRAAEDALRQQSEWLRITLASIGDAVITTDASGRVTFMNDVAEKLTAWLQTDAFGLLLPEVFRIVHEGTRYPVENPAMRALSTGTVTRLANHTVLIARDGSEHPIDDSAAPIRDESGVVVGAVLVFRDVSDRKDTELARAHLASIVESSDDAIISKTLQGIILSWNKGAERLFGYASDEAIGQPITMLIPVERRDEELDIIARIVRGDRFEHFETVRMARDGRRIDISLTVSPIRDASGAVVGASKVARDVSGRKVMEARERFLGGLDNAVRDLSDAEAITLTAARSLGDHLMVNRCAYAVVEPDEDTFELTGDYNRGVESIIGRYRFRQFGDACLRLLRAGAPYVVEDSEVDSRIAAEERTAYRTTAIRSVICVPVIKQGRFVAAMAVHATAPRIWSAGDVELVQRVASRCWESIERARVTLELQKSEYLFRALANSIANLAWMARPDGSIYWYNRQWYAYTGTTEADVEGWGWERLHDPAVLPAVKSRWQHSLDTGTPFEMVFPLRSAGGTFRRFLTRVNPVRDPRGQVIHWFGTNTDVEDERRMADANTDLRERERLARHEAEAASRAKDEFLAMLGHELRNPLSPITTALELMRLRGNDDSERERTVIERQVNHLTRLVDDLLDVSRISRGKIELKQEAVDIADIVAKAIEMAAPLLEQRVHTLDVDVPRGLTVIGDAMRLSQVVSNLVVNAAKYTPPGGRVTIRGSEESGEVVVRVRDTGIGIAAEVLPHVFDLFMQAPQALDRSVGGLGLGLTIVRNLVERHGGSVAAHSNGPGTGSEFVVRLPRAGQLIADDSRTLGRVRIPSPTTTGESYRVLVVDDNIDGAELLATALALDGHDARVAFDGPTALRIAAEFRPAVAFLDIGLPVMDGYELASRLLALPGLEGVRLVALTGYGQESDRERARDAGFHQHLVKPVDLAVVAELLRTLCFP